MIRKTVIAIFLTGGLCLTGCAELAVNAARQNPIPQIPARTTQANYMPQTSVKGDLQTQGTTAVESALAWSGKYADLSEKLVGIQEEKQQLDKENRRLLVKQAKLQTELELTQKELDEANDMLIQMRNELDKWKTNILGFREEMKETEMAQTEALTKVLELLGGEISTKTQKQKTSENEKDAS